MELALRLDTPAEIVPDDVRGRDALHACVLDAMVASPRSWTDEEMARGRVVLASLVAQADDTRDGLTWRH